MRLNLGCGFNKRDGYVNVDIGDHCAPDVVHDLEKAPWPWDDSSIDEIYMSHVLEHLGATTAVFGVVLLGVDWLEGLPLSWALWEGPFVFLFGLSILWLSARLDDRASTGPT